MTIKYTVELNTFWQIVARGISALTTFIITIIIGRRFGSVGLGDFVKITTYLAFFYLISDFGLNAVYLQKYISGKEDVSDGTWKSLFFLRVLMSTFLMLFAIVILTIFPHGTTQGYTTLARFGILLFTPTIFLQALITSANVLFQKYLRYDLSALSGITGSLVSLVLIISFPRALDRSTGVTVAIASLLLGSFATTGIALLLTKKLYQKGPHPPIVSSMKSLFITSIPLGITLIFNLIYFRVDSIILTLTRSTTEVGVYGLAYKIFEVFLVLPTFVMNSIYPIMLRETNAKRNRESRSIVFRSLMFLFISSIIVLLTLWYVAPLITRIKNDFNSGIELLRILALGIPFFFLSSLTMWMLIARKQQIILMFIYGISMMINIILNIMFIPTYGTTAAAWITVISEGIVLIMSGFVVWRLVIKDNRE